MTTINRIKYFIGIMLMLLVHSACEDTLDQTPSDKVGINRLLNKTSIVDFRNNVYAQLPKTFTDFSSANLLEAYTDDAFKAGNNNSCYEWHNGLLSTSETFFSWDIWSSCWKGIRSANLALEYLPQSKVSKDVIGDDDIDRYMDEVKILRAWYHFILIKNFGALPFMDVAYGPSFDGWNSLERPSYHDISLRIVEECDEVINNDALGLRRITTEENNFVNKAVAYALKSRVLLYNASALNNPDNDQAKWQLAANAAQQCIDSITPSYELVAIDDYNLLFSQAYNVFSKELIYTSNSNGANTTNYSNGIDLYLYGAKDQSSSCGAVPTQELVDCFELKNGTLPVTGYNTDHTAITSATSYSESAGTDPYKNRDARLNHSILFNGAYYGGMNNKPDSVIVYTYDGHTGSGFNNDPLSILADAQRRSCTGYYTRKYRTANYWGSSTGGTNAYKIFFRLAEVYLNLAEAQCELGKLTEAKAALDVVRKRAEQPKIDDASDFNRSKEDLMKRIRNERRVELCFEGHRFYDQRRWKVLDATNNMISGMKVTSTNAEQGPFSYERVKIDVKRNATTDKYLVLPIVSSEIRRLTGLGQPEAWQ